MAPATEIAILNIPENAILEKADSPFYTTWNDCLNTASAQEGYQRLYWGRQIDNPQTVTLLIDWSSITAHHAFQSSPQYTPFSIEFGKVLSAAPKIHHARLDPHASTPVLCSPITECMTIYFPTSFSTSSFDACWDVCKQTLEEEEGKKVQGFRAASAGWVVEELEYESEKCMAWAGFFGWESIDACTRYRETEEFRDTIGRLREGSKASEVHYVVFREK